VSFSPRIALSDAARAFASKQKNVTLAIGSPDGQRLALITDNGIELYTMPGEHYLGTISASSPPTDYAFVDDATFATVDATGRIRMWSTLTGKLLYELPVRTGHHH